MGKIILKDGSPEMELSDFGKIVEQEWFKSFEIRDEIFLHEYILMPNHLHAIVEISHGKSSEETDGLETHGRVSQRRVSQQDLDQHQLETHDCVSQPIESELSSFKRNSPIRLPKSISSLIAGFKSSVNTKIDTYIDVHQLDIPKYNRNNHFFQPNYHDHIIRNHFEYQNIQNYIVNNPLKWAEDLLHI